MRIVQTVLLALVLLFCVTFALPGFWTGFWGAAIPAYQGAQICKQKGYTFEQARQLNFQCLSHE